MTHQAEAVDILSMEEISKLVLAVANTASPPQTLAVGLVFDLNC